jgi:hypothetical protein
MPEPPQSLIGTLEAWRVSAIDPKRTLGLISSDSRLCAISPLAAQPQSARVSLLDTAWSVWGHMKQCEFSTLSAIPAYTGEGIE